MTIYGYAGASRGRDDGTDTLQSQRLRPVAVLAAYSWSSRSYATNG